MSHADTTVCKRQVVFEHEGSCWDFGQEEQCTNGLKLNESFDIVELAFM